MSDARKQPFSKRYGYRTAPKEITIREDAPEALRHFVLSMARDLGLRPSALRNTICDILHVRPDPGNWSEFPNIWGEVNDLVFGCPWFKFYDFTERVYEVLEGENGYRTEETRRIAQQFQGELNEFFVDEGIGWQLANGEIVVRGTESFEASIHSARNVLEDAGRMTASSEIHEALADLSRRPQPDLTGAVQHAMAALECVARDVCGDESATLGEIIKRYPGVIPKPLDDAVAKAWGFASEMARHIREGHSPDYREVELVVGIAATVATYLSR